MNSATDDFASGTDDLGLAFADHRDYLRVERGLSGNTLQAYQSDLRRYEKFLRSNHVVSPKAIEPELVRGFAESLSDEGLSAKSIARSLSSIRSFHRFALREDLIDVDPTKGVSTPRIGLALPKALERDEVVALIEGITGGDALSLRDRALLEILYSTGARISEVAGLDTGDCDLDERSLRVTGKGGKERYVPLGAPAVGAVDRYLALGRPALLESWTGERVQSALFLNARGGRLTRQGLWKIVKSRAVQAGMADELSPHVFRHSCATHMLEGGADIRAVQEMLGHASLSTTQVYTKVTTGHIHDVYLQSHPRARSGTRP
ncbi:MAG: site-specific tyrosine recombinase XerD [Acidobacteria bacterium]|nr:MAG: site-specific tyrosine recombinase XerD [Acidobacteriota bacterium]